MNALLGEAKALYYDLRDKIAGYHQLTGNVALWATMMPQINVLIDQYNYLLDSRPVTSPQRRWLWRHGRRHIANSHTAGIYRWHDSAEIILITRAWINFNDLPIQQ